MSFKRILMLLIVGYLGLAFNNQQQIFASDKFMLVPIESIAEENGLKTNGMTDDSKTTVSNSFAIVAKQFADLSVRFQHFEQKINEKSLVAAWPIDEGSGYEFLDVSGNKHTAFITGYNWNTTNSGLTTSFRKTGKRGGGVYLDGSQWLQVKDSKDLKFKTSFSICFWYKPSELDANGNILISRENSYGGFNISCDKKGEVIFECRDRNGKDYATSTILVGQENNWNFITITYNPTDFTSNIYVNGRLSESKKDIRLNTNIKEDLFIGSNNINKDKCFKGFMDEVCIFKCELSPALIYHLYVVGLPKIHTSCSATIDTEAKVWSIFGGNQIVPHTNDQNTLLLLRFNENVSTELGQMPVLTKKQQFYPGTFGAALVPVEQLNYKTNLDPKNGTVEMWIIVADEKLQSSDHKTLLNLPGLNKSGIEVYRSGAEYYAEVKNGNNITILKSGNLIIEKNFPLHIAITWNNNRIGLWINGVLISEKAIQVPSFTGSVELGGSGDQLFTDYIDDLKISDISRSWGEICPMGSTDSESASLDFRDNFEKMAHSSLYLWKSANGDNQWMYQSDSLVDGNDNTVLAQKNPFDMQVLIHPFAKGFQSSIEAGVIFSSVTDGWAGICSNVIQNMTDFNGVTFCINVKTDHIKLNIYKQGKIAFIKSVMYDFPVKIKKRYTLTLSVNNGIINGFVDGNNLISLKTNYTPEVGYGGLITENTRAFFDDVHFTSLTPAVKNSRLLEAHIFCDVDKEVPNSKVSNFSFNAFRWKKRYGLLPWKRTFKDPEPAGNIFGPDEDVQRPNKSHAWRSEDSANSDIMQVNGKIYYCMRGNPDMNGPHGPAAIGMLTVDQEDFDGIHFKDLNADEFNGEKIGLLNGNKDNASNCRDVFPRRDRLQVNDQGMIYDKGKIVIVVREFRNSIKGYSKFRRLTYGLFDLRQQRWVSNDVSTVPWSVMDPTNCNDKLKGLNGTPDLFSIKDPNTGQTVILLYYEQKGDVMVTGLNFDGKSIELNPDYPPKLSITKSNNDKTYGQRIFFDNGIYYMNVNSGSDISKLKVDWPDKFELYSCLDPYSTSWIESSENKNKTKPYFTRGNSTDTDNGAIWQGTMFKYRNCYYMYYENYHAVKDVNNPYDEYNKVNSGSRVGFATGN